MSLSRVHLAAALLATLTIALFWMATVVVEATGGPAAVAAVKSLIVVPGLFVLVPAIGVTGATLGSCCRDGGRAPWSTDGPPPASSTRTSISYKRSNSSPAGRTSP
jgi:hypothetical protein